MRTCVRDESGHAHARFRRALLTKNIKLIDAAARELQHVGLDDALRVLVVFAERRDIRYERAAARFAARVMMERGLTLAQPDGFEALAGHGVRATVDGQAVLIGSPRLMQEQGIDVSTREADIARLQREDPRLRLPVRLERPVPIQMVGRQVQ